MSNQDILSIVDMVLKTGIAGIIAMGFFWLANRYKMRQNNSELTSYQRKIQILEEISSHVGKVNNAFAKYSSLVIESTKFGKSWPAARKTELDKINKELVFEFDKLAEAEAKLLMLGEKTMEKTLRLYAARIALFRKQVYVGRDDISEQEIADIKSSIHTLREQFYDILSNRYDRLLSH